MPSGGDQRSACGQRRRQNSRPVNGQSCDFHLETLQLAATPSHSRALRRDLGGDDRTGSPRRPVRARAPAPARRSWSRRGRSSHPAGRMGPAAQPASTGRSRRCRVATCRTARVAPTSTSCGPPSRLSATAPTLTSAVFSPMAQQRGKAEPEPSGSAPCRLRDFSADPLRRASSTLQAPRSIARRRCRR